MPYIAFDLDALKHVPDVARSAGLAESDVGYGLVRLWAYCWTEKTDVVTPIHLAGFFGSEKAAPALVAFGHLAPSAADFRVRGAEKYLRITAAQSAAGKKNAKNLSRGTPGRKPRKTRDPAGDPPENPPSTGSPGSPRPLPPSTEHRAPTPIETIAGLPPADPYKQLVGSLFDAFAAVKGSKYRPTGPDWKALERLRQDATAAEIRLRWGRGLRGAYKRDACTFVELEAKWNALATDEPSTGKGPVEPQIHGDGPIVATTAEVF